MLMYKKQEQSSPQANKTKNNKCNNRDDNKNNKIFLTNNNSNNNINRKRCQRSIGLKDFPIDILDNICSNISINDIISLSETCSILKNKIESHIYNYIRILDIDHIDDEDELIIQKHFGNFKDESLENESWWVYNNISTITSTKHILMLFYNILLNPNFGKYIKTIEINLILKPSPWKRCKFNNNIQSIWNQPLHNFLSKDELDGINIDSKSTLFDCLLMLLDYTPNLENLIISKFSLDDVAKLLVKTPNLKQLKIMIYENDQYVELPLQNLKKLKKLRIKFQENTENLLEKLSLNLEKCNILSNLEILLLKYDKTDFNYLSTPTWFSFFKPLLPSNKIIFTSLKKFELKDCYFGSNQKELVDNLLQLIPFNQIDWLSLQIYEYSHKNIKHSICESDDSQNYNDTVLSYLSPHLASIKSIRIKPTRNCKSCQFDSILNFLTNHQNLENIWLSTDSLNSQNYMKILNIFKNFKNLSRLAYFDEFIYYKLINNLKNWFMFEHKIMDFDIFKFYESEVLRQDIDPIFNCYRIDEFKKFNERERDLLVLFWQHFLHEFGLEMFLGNCNKQRVEVKLFGYNFKVDKSRKIILLYISKDVGYVDLVYF